MNKSLIVLITGVLLTIFSLSTTAQQGDNLDEALSEEETMGGIGGTGIRSMNRPDILERPEHIERPEILDSREALDDSVDLDSSLDTEGAELEKPEPKDD